MSWEKNCSSWDSNLCYHVVVVLSSCGHCVVSVLWTCCQHVVIELSSCCHRVVIMCCQRVTNSPRSAHPPSIRQWNTRLFSQHNKPDDPWFILKCGIIIIFCLKWRSPPPPAMLAWCVYSVIIQRTSGPLALHDKIQLFGYSLHRVSLYSWKKVTNNMHQSAAVCIIRYHSVSFGIILYQPP